MNPVMVNIEDFANFAELTDDDEIMQPLVITFMKNLPYASGFYYTSKTSTLDGGLFVHSGGWIPPKNWDQTTREWYKLAMHNPNELCFTSPFVDADTGELAITISKTVNDMQGKVKGVVACDILLSRLVTLFQEIEISKHGQINMIDKDGHYMTHVNSAKIMKDNYFNETSFKGNMNEWMNGELKSLVTNKNFYAICKIGYSPWFIVIEGL